MCGAMYCVNLLTNGCQLEIFIHDLRCFVAEFGDQAVDWVKPSTHASLRVHAGLCRWMCVLEYPIVDLLLSLRGQAGSRVQVRLS